MAVPVNIVEIDCDPLRLPRNSGTHPPGFVRIHSPRLLHCALCAFGYPKVSRDECAVLHRATKVAAGERVSLRHADWSGESHEADPREWRNLGKDVIACTSEREESMDFTGVARILVPVIGKPVGNWISRRSLAWRVSWRVAQATKRRGWGVSRRVLRVTLADRSVLEELARADGGGYPHALARIRKALPLGTSEDVARDLLEIVATAYVGLLPDRESTQLHVSREFAGTREEIQSVRSEVVRLHESLDLAGDLDVALRRFHPWRRFEVKELQATWPQVTRLVWQLSDVEHRAVTLADWAAAPPDWDADAPPAVFGWLALLATESPDGSSVAVHFLTTALARGISPRTEWRVKLYQQLPSPLPAADWFEAHERHPLVLAMIAEQAGDFSTARDVIMEWRPSSDPEEAQGAAILARAALSAENFVDAVKLGATAYETWQSTGAGLVAVDGLLALSSTRRDATSRLNDLRAALELATRLRDDRRSWGVDPVPALSKVVRALALLDQPERAIESCLPIPWDRPALRKP